MERPMKTGRISLVPDYVPQAGPPLDITKKGYLTSNHADYDPANIIRRLDQNKLTHGNFDVHLVS